MTLIVLFFMEMRPKWLLRYKSLPTSGIYGSDRKAVIFMVSGDGQYLDACICNSITQHFCIGIKLSLLKCICIYLFCFPCSSIPIGYFYFLMIKLAAK